MSFKAQLIHQYDYIPWRKYKHHRSVEMEFSQDGILKWRNSNCDLNYRIYSGAVDFYGLIVI